VKRETEFGLIALGVAWLASRMFVRASGSSSTTTIPNGIGAWRIVPTVNTGRGIPSAQFDREHYAAITRALVAHNTPASLRPKLARAMLAQMISETGRLGEWNHNVSNIVQNRAWRGDVFVLPGTTGTERAYPSLQAGVDDYVNAVTNASHGGILGDLAAGTKTEAEWYVSLRREGWSTAAPTDADVIVYNNILARLRAEFPG